jgi:molybdopterin molybdotransferase
MANAALLSVSEATERLLSVFQPVTTECLPLGEAYGRVLAEDIHATNDSPPFANSSMDGFALRAEDVSAASTQAPVRLRVVADIPAGYTSSVTLHARQAARIMTGAPLPAGADAVIPVEDTDFPSRAPGMDAPATVQILRPVKPGDYVRPRGQDMQRGELVLEAQQRLHPQTIALLATLGIPQVTVYRRPKAAILATGDELLPVEAALRPGTIHESNSYMLAGQVHACGAEALPLGIIPDQPEAIQAALERAVLAGVDVIISSAGVSVGAFDFVRQVVEQHGRLDFWRVNMRPGKPLAFGEFQKIPFIGLPGNPVSSFVGCEVFVRPALLKLAGLRHWQPWRFPVELAEALESDGRESYLRAQVKQDGDRWLARLAGHQGSGNLRGLSLANALLIIPSEVKSVPSGGRVFAQWLGDPPNI